MRNIRIYITLLIITIFISLQIAIANALAPSKNILDKTVAEFNVQTSDITAPLDSVADFIQDTILAEGPRFNYEFLLGPFVTYWDEVAQCETRGDWQDHGTWAGGLGIYTVGQWRGKEMGTWERWGGEQFAPTPQWATKFHQIIVANRIAMFGYKELIIRDPEQAKRSGVPPQYLYDKNPTGFGGWGCIKSKSTKKWRIGLPQEKLFYNVYLPVDPQYYCPQYEPLFEKYGLPTKLFSYIAWTQSKCNNYHPQGGILAIPEKYYSELNSEFGFLPPDLNEPEKNVIAAAWITYFHADRLSAWDYDFKYNKNKPNTSSQNEQINKKIKNQ